MRRPTPHDEALAKPACRVGGCGRPVKARGYCNTHNMRRLRKGSAYEDVALRTPCGEPLRWLHAHAGHEGDECLIWPYARMRNGYCTVDVDRKTTLAHRYICEIAHGAPPSKSHHAAHSCGNGHLGCLNQRHLRWATHAENEADKLLHGRIPKGEQHSTHRLKAEDVLRLRAKYALGGASYADLAAEVGVHPNTAYCAIKGRSWGWLA